MLIGTPNRHNAGYCMNDDRNGGGVLSEADIQTCPHCQAVIKLSKEQGDFCNKCMKPVCPHCAARMDLYGCESFLRRLEHVIELSMRYKTVDEFLQEAGLVPPVPPQPIFTGLLKV
jgi:hypothetical protein